MNRLFVAAVALGMVGSGSLLGAAGVASAETALIVPGTSPSPYPALRSLYHFNPATRPAIGERYYNSAGATREVVPYPGALWPLTGPDSPTLAESVTEGTDALDARIRNTEGPIAVAGLSQGVLALNAEQARLANDPSAPPPDQLTFIKAGNPEHLFRRMAKPGTKIPVLGYTVNPPVDSQYNTVEVVAQYDIFSHPLDRPGNLLALANAIVAGGLTHTDTAFSDPATVPAHHVTTEVNSRGATTTTYFLPAEQLPLTQLLQQQGMPQDMADSLDRILRPMVDRAYGPEPAAVPVTGIGFPALADLTRLPGRISTPISVPVNAVTNTVRGVTIANQVAKLLPKNNGGQNGVQLPKLQLPKNPLLPKRIPLLPKGKRR